MFLNFLFGYFIYHVKIDCHFTNTKRKKSEIPLTVKKSSVFVKHAWSGDEVNMYSCCCLKHGYSKPKCHNLHNVRLIWYLFKELHKQASEFSSIGGWCETQHIFVIKLKLQVRLSMQSVHRYTLLMVKEKKELNFFEKSGDAAEDVQCTLSYWWNQSKFCLAQ